VMSIVLAPKSASGNDPVLLLVEYGLCPFRDFFGLLLKS
jgi:hypothetical protein